ncbi:MAG: trifunctional transcriptional regulator/proline dehydrogenase/L-glutamate gamma-semialdehyde dehydrogenase [Rubrivivax sp. SCN 71-131]|nr:MAG: trifunctional transcriptional regulator/proline dehydrogenase/L-glutamate gamma-semialdehyde dehydrogenase [Rubrivivax sp. SCN 71-131]
MPDRDPNPAPTLTPLAEPTPRRAAITALTRVPEPERLPELLELASMSLQAQEATQTLALALARGVREQSRGSGRAGLVQALLQEFALSSSEGVALMCLAEALLRIPDAATRDALIRDKIGDGQGVDWQRHLGQSPSMFVNAAAWGLLITGKLVATHSDQGLSATLRRAVARGGEPLIRRGVDMAMRLMGEQFVTGQTIAEALHNARDREAMGFRYSYDMLGEAALTAGDADRYRAAYETAIHAIGAAAAGRGPIEGPGISIKLSALHPRWARAQHERVMRELYPTLLALALLAKGYDIGLNIDAEEAERLEISLDLLERLAHEPQLSGWAGLGFVIQAYQKRCPAVVDWIVDLARRSGRRLMVRLVKGAYWDSEIKRAQEGGLADYPVYTRKAHTDVAYIACARKLLAAPEAVFPQFATHNAHTLAAIHTLAEPRAWQPGQYEFQCLHGMGEPLYEQMVSAAGDDSPVPAASRRPCRVYAPVGSHETLLAYLVRRLLENGANTSFVNRIADAGVSLEALLQDPARSVREAAAQEGTVGLPHPAIPLPQALHGARRLNSRGLDLAAEDTLQALAASFAAHAAHDWRAAPMLAAKACEGPWLPLVNPADADDLVGHVRHAEPADVQAALAAATAAAAHWAATPPAERAAVLRRAADRLEAQMPALLPLIVREAGKTCANAVAEVREAVDFLRYYAAEVQRDFDNATHLPLGPVVCISPWNFPLAIFTGQVAAALAAGNVVLAKPAEQTPLIAAAAVQALHEAGVARGALQLLPGLGETVGAALVADARVQGVLFTGSTEVARLLQRQLCTRLSADGRPVPLIAETGGQNALIVDSSALAEQAVADAVSSAFDSAGQRCSALRLLCVQEDVAPRLVQMLQGATQELRTGDPRALATDVGPVIDAAARAGLEAHVQAMAAAGRRVWRAPAPTRARGHFVPPTLIEIERVSELRQEVFGPVLHVLRYPREELARVLETIAATGYGLTQGVHTRIDETVAQVVEASVAGNIYVNRNIVGAVVGVQPFGGQGLSGTGPKAGGPLYLLRLLRQAPPQAARLAVARNAIAAPPAGVPVGRLPQAGERQALAALRTWAQAQGLTELAARCDQAAAESPVGPWLMLQGPTGEANLYAVRPRAQVLGLAAPGPAGDGDRLVQLAAILAVGAHALWPAQAQALADRLPPPLREHITLAADWTQPGLPIDAVLLHGARAERLRTAQALAARPGPIVGLTALGPGDARVPLERLVIERSVAINTAAAGGNASLMTLAP